MRHLYLRTSSFKRLFSASIARRSGEDGGSDNILSPKKGCAHVAEVSSSQQMWPRPTWKCFSYEEIFNATGGFRLDNLVGRGGYADVYKGVLEDGSVIAVKRLTKASTDEQREKEFLTELGTIGHVQHPNVLALLGCCVDKGLHLIFEFSLRGSVSSRLHDESLAPMSWNVRYKVALGTARGLHYLHKVCQRRIIHRDIKASNILLTEDFEPQISDFGLAKWLPSQWSHHSVMPIEGTFGYLAPEYFMNGIVDEKTDVFAYGVLLLEVISGRMPVDGSHQSLINWAKPHLNRDDVEEVVDGRIGEEYVVDELKKLVFVASLCIRASPSWRPSMSEVLQVLEGDEIDKDNWKMPDEEEDDCWGFDDLECDSSVSTSPLCNSCSSS